MVCAVQPSGREPQMELKQNRSVAKNLGPWNKGYKDSPLVGLQWRIVDGLMLRCVSERDRGDQSRFMVKLRHRSSRCAPSTELLCRGVSWVITPGVGTVDKGRRPFRVCPTSLNVDAADHRRFPEMLQNAYVRHTL